MGSNCVLQAQTPTVLFPGLSGKVLLDSLFDRYRPDTVLPYAIARDTLYAKVLALDDDTLRCIYTGHALYLDPTKDPTQYVYLNGIPNGMNAEHAYPQSKGTAEGNARSDMHHLYPVRIAINEKRGDLPYSDIPDNETTIWYRGAQSMTSIPAARRDEYAEFKPGRFEPRESVKGDLARSVFYIQTMYRSQTNLADPTFFESQRLTLCQWHRQDPADAIEIRKTWRIAPYQDGKPNPFVLDCTLAHRCWCQDVPPACASSVTDLVQNALYLQSWRSSERGTQNITAQLPFSGQVSLRVTDLHGRLLQETSLQNVQEGSFAYTLALPPATAQIFLLEMILSGSEKYARQTIKIYGF
jgi:hypothetical protein